MSVRASALHASLVFLAETKRLISYRVQFWCELLLSTLVELLVTVAVWTAVFQARGVEQIGNYTLGEMLLYVIVAVFFAQATRGSGTGTFARDIYDGSLTKYLVYPLSVYSYKLGTYLPRSLFAVVGSGLALLGIALLGHWPAGVTLGIGQIAAGLFALGLATVLFFLMLFCLEAFAFWVDHVWALSVILNFMTMLLSGKWIPMDLFPAWLQAALHYTPFPYLLYFPVSVFLGTSSGAETLQGFVVLGIWVVLVYLLSRIIYDRGLKTYTGVGI